MRQGTGCFLSSAKDYPVTPKTVDEGELDASVPLIHKLVKRQSDVVQLPDEPRTNVCAVIVAK